MSQTTYKAIFSNGIEKTRTSNRTYTHAWIVYSDDNVFCEFGFSGNRNLAVKAASTCESHRYNGSGHKCLSEIVEVQS